MTVPTTTVDVVLADIRRPKATLRAVKQKALRAELSRILSIATDWPPEMRLRAQLVLGRALDADVVSADVLQRALSPEDCALFSGRLAIRRTYVDASETFTALRTLLIHASSVKLQVIADALQRTRTKWHTQRLSPTLATVLRYHGALETLLQRASEVANTRRTELPTRLRSSLARLVGLALLDATTLQKAEDPTILRVILAAQDVVEADFEDILRDRSELQAALDRVLDAMYGQLQNRAHTGDVTAFTAFAELLLRVRLLHKGAKERLSRMWSDRAVFQPAIQRALMVFLEIEETAPMDTPFDANDPASVKREQLASALIRSWLAARTSTQAQEAFDELTSVLGGFFGIYIKGNVGEVVPFDPAVHELASLHGDPSGMVKTLRPRVESTGGAIGIVLIKALGVFSRICGSLPAPGADPAYGTGRFLGIGTSGSRTPFWWSVSLCC